MRWHRIGASPVYQGQNEAGSWWQSGAPPPGGWHWGKYHNRREAGGRQRKSQSVILEMDFLKPDCIT